MAQYKMLKDTHTFFAHGVDVPFLGGISRDNLPSELALTSVFYMLFPAFWGYVLNYLAKLILAVVGSYLLAGEVCKRDNETYAPYKYLSVLCGLAYGMLNLFPNFGIPFATIPLAVYILLKIDRAVTLRAAIPWYVALFVYPFVSYFSYHGLFLCGYLLIAVIWVSIARKKVAKRLLVALPVLALGFVCFEYRLFSVMLFGKEETIRGLMVGQDLSIPEMLRETWDVLVNGMMHDIYDNVLVKCIVEKRPYNIDEAINNNSLKWYDDSYLLYPVNNKTNHMHSLSCYVLSNEYVMNILKT